MVKFVGNTKSKENKRVMEGNLKPFMEEMRQGINRMMRDGYDFGMEDQSDEKILRARKDLVDEIKTVYERKDREIEIAIKALAVWYRRKKMEKREAEMEW